MDSRSEGHYKIQFSDLSTPVSQAQSPGYEDLVSADMVNG